MAAKLILLLGFFACMIAVGIYARRSAHDVNGFVLGGRSVGPWLTAFAYGTSYFSAVVFVGYAVGLGFAGTADAGDDPSFGCGHDAGVFWQALWQ